jgi:hypothetical protein
MLDVIEAGMTSGQRYSAENSAKNRAAWRVVKEYCPEKTMLQCREIINTWVKNGVVYKEEYRDPVEHKPPMGLRVDPTKRPTQ